MAKTSIYTGIFSFVFSFGVTWALAGVYSKIYEVFYPNDPWKIEGFSPGLPGWLIVFVLLWIFSWNLFGKLRIK